MRRHSRITRCPIKPRAEKKRREASARKNVNDVQRGSDLLRMMVVDDTAVISASACTLYGARRFVIESRRELGSYRCNRPNRRCACRRHFSDLSGEGNQKQCTCSATGLFG